VAPLRLLASRETLARIEQARLAFDRWMQTDEVVFESVAAGDAATIGDLTVTVGEVDHDSSSVGYRFTGPNGASLAIPGDSAPCAGLDSLLAGAHTAVLECSTPDDVPVPGHLTPSTLAATAERAELSHLVVTHRYPLAQQIDVAAEVATRWPGRLTIADDGDVFEVG
jgi:ribonuclease BN (tRNA processing enzyme)